MLAEIVVLTLLTLLCMLPRTDAAVQTEKSVVLDFMDLAPGKNQNLTCNSICNVYATGYASDEDLLSKIYIATGNDANPTTLSDLAIRATINETGEKVYLQIPANENFTITNGNLAASKTTPFFIFITTDLSPIMVVDAAKASIVSADRTVVVMSPFPLLTLRSFDTGDLATVTVSVAAPDSQITLMNVTAASAKNSVAKIYGPIATVKPSALGSDFSFTVEAQKACDYLIEPGAILAFSSPGNAGQNATAVYGHVLSGEDVDCIFSTTSTNDIKAGIIATFSNVEKASILLIRKDGGFSSNININLAFGAGVLETGGTARDIKVHWDSFNIGISMLEAIFIVDTAPQDAVTSTSLPTTTTTDTSPPTTTSGSALKSSTHGLILLAVVLPMLSTSLRLVCGA